MNPDNQVKMPFFHKFRTVVTMLLILFFVSMIVSLGIVLSISFFSPKKDTAIQQDENNKKSLKNDENTIDKGKLVYILENLSSVINTFQDVVAGYDDLQNGSPQEIAALSLTAKNIIRNSSFESASGVQPRQWRYILDSTTGNSKQSAEGIRSGNYGLKFFPSNGEKGYDLGLSQDVTITVPGRTYVLSAYLKNTNVNSDAKVKIGFWNNYRNAYGPMEEIALSGTKDWYRVSMNVTTDGLINDWC